MKKENRSESIDEAARRRALHQTLQGSRARNAHLRPEDVEEIIEQALAEVRAKRLGTRR
jgi:hypothetical protein